MHHTKTPAPALVAAAFAAIYLIWGSTYLAILFGLETLPPFLLSGIRFTVAGAILLAWRRLQGESPTRAGIRQNSFGGVLMLFGGTGTVVWVEQHIASGLAAIIVAGMPLWFVLLDKRQWAYNFSNKFIIGGVLVGFAGVLMLFGRDGAGLSALWPLFVLLAGCISWAYGSLYVKYHPSPHSTMMNAGIQMLAAGAFSLLFSWGQGELAGFDFRAVTLRSWLGLAYLLSFGSLIGYLSYVWLLSVRPAVQVGTYAYVNPVVAMLLGWAFAGEAFTGLQCLALVVILSGVLLVNAPKYKRFKPKKVAARFD